MSDKLLCAAGAPLIAAAISEGKTLYVGLGAAAGAGGGLGVSGSAQIQLYATPGGTVGIVVTIGYNPNLLPNVGVSANVGVAISASSNPPAGQTSSGSMSASSGPILAGVSLSAGNNGLEVGGSNIIVGPGVGTRAFGGEATHTFVLRSTNCFVTAALAIIDWLIGP